MAYVSKKRSNGNGASLPNLLDDFFGNRFFSPAVTDFGYSRTPSLSVPPANISEYNNEFLIELFAPGLSKEDFRIEIDNSVLSVSCEQKKETKTEDENYLRKEFSRNAFTRSFELPENIMEDSITAKYENGILRVLIPKSGTNQTENKKGIKVQ